MPEPASRLPGQPRQPHTGCIQSDHAFPPEPVPPFGQGLGIDNAFRHFARERRQQNPGLQWNAGADASAGGASGAVRRQQDFIAEAQQGRLLGRRLVFEDIEGGGRDAA